MQKRFHFCNNLDTIMYIFFFRFTRPQKQATDVSMKLAQRLVSSKTTMKNLCYWARSYRHPETALNQSCCKEKHRKGVLLVFPINKAKSSTATYRAEIGVVICIPGLMLFTSLAHGLKIKSNLRKPKSVSYGSGDC